MIKYLLPNEGAFYKANLHSHSSFSDGTLNPAELKDLYKKSGYSILAITDYDRFSDCALLSDDSFLVLNGIEIGINDKNFNGKYGKTCHLCAVSFKTGAESNVLKDVIREYNSDCISRIMDTAAKSALFVTYNHPSWSMEGYEDYINYNGMHAMEIYNHSCRLDGYDEHNSKQYDDLLKSGKRIYCIATDGNRGDMQTSDLFGGFTMIKARNLSHRSVEEALKNGSFYSSEGPEVYELYIEDKTLYIKCSGVSEICLNTPYRIAASKKGYGRLLKEASFKLRGDEGYFRLTLTDKNGNKAYTNAYFTDEIFEEAR